MNTQLSKVVTAAFLFTVVPFVGSAFASGDHGDGHGSSDTHMEKKDNGHMAKKGDAKHGGHWAYEGDGGPTHWGELKAEYETCSKGMKQSPIDVTFGRKADLSGIQVNYKKTGLDILNNGHTIQVNIAKGSNIEVDRKQYDLLQFHFHSPSEHLVNGKPYDMVAHLVHKETDGNALAVIGVMFKEGDTNSALSDIWKHLPKKAGEKHAVTDVEIDASKLLPVDRNYFHYSGSLTTPPCSEGVKWMVLEEPVTVSKAQLKAFRAIISDNVRPAQPLNGRIIEQKN